MKKKTTAAHFSRAATSHRSLLPTRPFLRGLACLLVALSLCMGACSSTRARVSTEADETIATWKQARYFQAEGRYELAKQYYTLALASARTQSALEQLQRELYTVDMQIRTMR